MTKPTLKLLAIVALLLFCGLASGSERPKGDKTRGLPKTTLNSHLTFFTINKLSNIYRNDGDGSVSPSGDAGTLIYPKGSGKTCSYEDGMLVGGYRLNRLFMDGSTYGSGMQAGRIITAGTGVDIADAQPDDATLPIYRVLRVRPDINPTADADACIKKLSSDELPYTSAYVGLTAEDLYNQYITDWNEWPASQGAPFVDVDSNGVYDPTIDIPGIQGADQTLWHVYNDMNDSKCFALYGAHPIGLEIQRTIWGYNRQGSLGNMIFMKYRVINKSGAQLDSCYYTMFSDVDVGDGWDDLAGCDSTLSLGYVYNGGEVDAVYGSLPPPCNGYVYFQGPLVAGAPTDSGVFDLKRVYGKKNLGMSSFAEFINGGPAEYVDPTLNGTIITGAGRWYNLMKGLSPRSGIPWVGLAPYDFPTKYVCWGNPATKTGWIDGVFPYTPYDRRIVLTSGPFSMSAGDVQEAVIADIVTEGADRLSSVALMYQYAADAHDTYNNLFQVVSPPPAPPIVKSELDQEVTLTWFDYVKTPQIESFTSRGYTFQGYRLFQLHGSGPNATFDKVLFDYDKSAGLKRAVDIKTDAIRGGNLVNGVPYYFGVASWSHNPFPKSGDPSDLYSSPTIIQCVPQKPAFGNQYKTTYGQTVKFTKVGSADGAATISVASPQVVKSGNYTVDFNHTGSADLLLGTTTLGTFDLTAPVDEAVIGGLKFSLSNYTYNTPTAMDNYSSVGSGTYDLRDGSYLNATGYYWSNCGRNDLADAIPPTRSEWDLEFRFTGVPAVTTDPQSQDTTVVSGGQWTTYYCRGANGSLTPLTKNHINIRAPFELWDIENNVQIQYAVVDRNRTGGTPNISAPWGDAGTWANSGNTAWFRIWGREYIVAIYKPYNASTAATDTYDPTDSLATWMLWFYAQDDSPPSVWHTGDTVRVHFINAAVAGSDKLSFSLDAGSISKATEVDQVKQINVYPNPYFAFNRLETNRYNRFVTFNHLPQRATIRIFTILGQLVRTLVKNTQSQFCPWDLNNDAGLPVGSGMYVVHIDMPTLGQSKVLKLAVIQPMQILDRALQ